jgi:hypothetical protein
MEALRMARRLDRYRPSARMMLEPWLVELALESFGDRRLTLEQQRQVVSVTRAPQTVRWPAWWRVRA